MYMEYRVELGINNMEKKMQKSPHSGQNSSTYLFSNFDQFSYFSHKLIISYPI